MNASGFRYDDDQSPVPLRWPHRATYLYDGTTLAGPPVMPDFAREPGTRLVAAGAQELSGAGALTVVCEFLPAPMDGAVSLAEPQSRREIGVSRAKPPRTQRGPETEWKGGKGEKGKGEFGDSLTGWTGFVGWEWGNGGMGERMNGRDCPLSSTELQLLMLPELSQQSPDLSA